MDKYKYTGVIYAWLNDVIPKLFPGAARWDSLEGTRKDLVLAQDFMVTYPGGSQLTLGVRVRYVKYRDITIRARIPRGRPELDKIIDGVYPDYELVAWAPDRRSRPTAWLLWRPAAVPVAFWRRLKAEFEEDIRHAFPGRIYGRAIRNRDGTAAVVVAPRELPRTAITYFYPSTFFHKEGDK